MGKIVLFDNSLNQTERFSVEITDHVELVRYKDEGVERVEVPEMIEGLPVTVIRAKAFKNCEKIREVILPDTVAEIGILAFWGCTLLRNIRLPKGLKRLPVSVFSFCRLYAPELVLPEGLEVIASYAFFHGCDGGKLVIPDSVREIGIGAFCLGPELITKLPYDKGWYMEWPYGETVAASGSVGKVTDYTWLGQEVYLFEVTFDGKVESYIYPGDFLDGTAAFTEEVNRDRLKDDIKSYWKTEETALKLSDLAREVIQGGLVSRKHREAPKESANNLSKVNDKIK